MTAASRSVRQSMARPVAASTQRYLRVVVLYGERRIDIALPGSATVGDIIPSLIDLAGVPPNSAEPLDWHLTRLAADAIDRESTLVAAGIVDGSILCLAASGEDVPTVVEDVQDGVEEAVRRSGVPWTARSTILFVCSVIAGSAVMLMLLPIWRGPFSLSLLFAGAGLVLMTCGLGVVAGRRKMAVLANALVAVGAGWVGFVVGLLIRDGVSYQIAILGACGAALLSAALVRTLTPAVAPTVAAIACLSVAALLFGAVVWIGPDALGGCRIFAVLAVLAIGIVPRLSIGFGGLVALDYRVRRFGALPMADLERRFEQSSALLVGGLLGCSATAGVAAVGLMTSTSGWDQLLAAAVPLALLLRARMLSRRTHVLAVVVPAVAAAGTVATMFVLASSDRQLPFVVGVLALSICVGAASLLTPSPAMKARMTRILDAVELVLVLVLLGLVCAGFGLFDAVRTATQ